MQEAMKIWRIDSSLGTLGLQADPDFLYAIHFDPPEEDAQGPVGSPPPLVAEAMQQLGAYFAGKLRVFDLPLRPQGTDFQRKVWQALLEIPYGKTISYLGISENIGDPKSTRAVGAANGRNPIPIVIPCHRVIGSDGSLTGYGGGIWRKQWLLEHESLISNGIQRLL